MSDVAYVIVAGLALLYLAVMILAWALCVCASTGDRIQAAINQEIPAPDDLMAIYQAVHREAEQITKEAAR